jgi:hypothetical protein
MKQYALVLFATLFTVALFAQTPEVKRSITRVTEKKINGKNYELTLKDDEVAKLKINGKVIPKAQYAKFQDQIDQLKVGAYEMEAEKTSVAGDKYVSAQEIYLSDGGDLTPEQKTTNNMVEEELLKDGLITERSYKLDLNDKEMLLNGKALSKTLHDKYTEIYYTYSGEKRCEGCRFRLKLDKQTNSKWR